MIDLRDLSEAEAEALRPHMPTTLQTIARAVGALNTIRLIAEYGGRQISCPSKCDDNHPLARIIGAGNVLAINRLIANEGMGDGLRRLVLPNGTKLKRVLLRKRIRAAVEAGMPKREAAARFGMTNRGIRRICNMEGD